MGRALYRKYRSKNLAEIVGQEHITATLDNALKNNSISHAYLFTGPRGVGKTSIARILAHEVNQLPYDENATHLDIIEIDAASNRRIDEIRSLREKVNNAPSSVKYKVYIIDEVHMLTKEAFNALLKTLEEPPTHAIFILATTEAHKLPETIVSRTQRFAFKPVESDKAVKHLRHIADQESIDIEDDALKLIAEHGGGSFRDSISLLDQLSGSDGVIDLAAAQQALGIAPDESISKIVKLLSQNYTATLLNALKGLHEQGYQAPQVAKQLAKRLRRDLLEGQSPLTSGVITKLLQRLIDVPASHDPDALLEIVLLEVALAAGAAERGERREERGEATEHPTKDYGLKTKDSANENVVSRQSSVVSQKTKSQKNEKPTGANQQKTEDRRQKTTVSSPDDAAWPNVLKTLKSKHNTLYGIARMATPQWKDNELTLAFNFPFHQKRMDDPRNKQIVSDIIGKQTGNDTKIICIVNQAAPNEKTGEEAPKTGDSTPDLQTISDIFGGAEVLE